MTTPIPPKPPVEDSMNQTISDGDVIAYAVGDGRLVFGIVDEVVQTYGTKGYSSKEAWHTRLKVINRWGGNSSLTKLFNVLVLTPAVSGLIRQEILDRQLAREDQI